MVKTGLKSASLLIIFAFICVTIFSCSTTRKVKYFQDVPDSGVVKTLPASVYVEPKIQADDILTILILTIDPAAPQLINANNISVNGTGLSSGASSTSAAQSTMSTGTINQQQIVGYLVDKKGDIDLPVLKKIHVAGLTTTALKDTLEKRASVFYNNPTAIVRFANFRVNVAGEVQKPGVYVLPNERVSILDALTLAGDLTIFGKRENVLVKRYNDDGSTSYYRINLKKSDIMESPAYYLHQNDYIYVEPRKAKSDATDASQQKYISIATAVLSLIIVFATRR